MARLCAADGDDVQYHQRRMAGYLAGEHHPHLALPPRVIFVAMRGDALAGYIAAHLTRRHDCDGELQWIHVHPQHRGTGIAARLLHLPANWLIEHSARRVCVDVEPDNERARRFYRRCGATDLDAHWMVWEDISVVADPDDDAAERSMT